MSSKMRLSEFFGLKYENRVKLLFEWFEVDKREQQYVLKDYNNDYSRVYRNYFHFHGIITDAIINDLLNKGVIIDDTVGITTRVVRDKNGGHGHVIFGDDDLQKYKGDNEHISSNLTTKDSKEYPAIKLDFDPFLGNKYSMITEEPFKHRKSKYGPREKIGKMSIRDYKNKIKQIKEYFKNKK